MIKSFVWCKDQQKFVPKSEFYENAPPCSAAVIGDVEGFVSPVDGSVIDDRGKLRRHNKKHGVTDFRDYGQKYFDDKARERQRSHDGSERKAVQDRKQDLANVIDVMSKRKK